MLHQLKNKILKTMVYASNFIVSLLPLWFSIFVKLCFSWKSLWFDKEKKLVCIENNIFALVIYAVFFIIIIVSFCIQIIILNRKNKEGNVYILCNIKKLRGLTVEYLLTYVLPLLAFDFTQNDDISLFIIYIILLTFLVCIYENYVPNVFFEIIGYRYYDSILSESNVEFSGMVISKENLMLRIGEKISLTKIEKIYITKS